MMGIGPVPEQRENGGVIETLHRSEPAELPGILNEREILSVKGNEAGGDFHHHGEKTGTTIHKKKKKHCSLSVFSVGCSVTLLRGM